MVQTHTPARKRDSDRVSCPQGYTYQAMASIAPAWRNCLEGFGGRSFTGNVTALRGGGCPEPPPEKLLPPGDIGVLQGYSIKSQMACVPNRYSATRASLLYGVSRGAQPPSARDMPAPGWAKTIKPESTANSRTCQASESASSNPGSSSASSPARRNFHPLSLMASTAPCCARRASSAMERPV